ncbi:hypothetical protein P8C59_008087 [Phyllachora maydis]|uniref:Uncharacterized protein n=1 Tax=Phyllachora maydis TaxID=1825666 RepID=A0AAD9IAS9_9PEZI|nr:hypothetical protein P8C59_008087 [Phyllachora maydis]
MEYSVSNMPSFSYPATNPNLLTPPSNSGTIDCDIGLVDPYLGSYAVSSEPDFQTFVDPVTGMVVRPGVVTVASGLDSGLAATASAPLLAHGFHPSHAPHVGSIEDLRGDPGMFSGHGMNGFARHMSPCRRPPMHRRKTTSTHLTRRAATARAAPKPESTPVIPSIEDDDEKEELTLRDDAPEEEKLLFGLRKKYIHEKGKGMWEEMKAQFTAKNKGHWEKAALQMKVSRAVAKYGVWPQRELDRLEEAFRFAEEHFYQSVLEKMKELGGCKCWDWKPPHIEAQLVKMGFVEATVDGKSGARRRKNKIGRRRAATTPSSMPQPQPQPQPQPHAQHPAAALHHPHAGLAGAHLVPAGAAPGVMHDWAGGLGLHPALAVPMSRQPSYESHVSMGAVRPHHLAAAMAAAAAAAAASPDDQIPPPVPEPTFTEEQTDGYLDQIFVPGALGGDFADGSMSPEEMDLAYEEQQPQSGEGPEELGGELVSAQGSEQMLQGVQGESQAQPCGSVSPETTAYEGRGVNFQAFAFSD